MEITDNTKTLANALAEINLFRQKLEAAQQIIREAREQKPVAVVDIMFGGRPEIRFLPGNYDYRGLMYAAPVPAMPMQDDKILSCMVCDLIHLLEFARIETPTRGDLPQIENLINSLKARIEYKVRP